MPVPPFTALAESLPETVPFVGPEALARRSGIVLRARIGANESGFGPSPRVKAAIAAAAEDIWSYPDPEGYDLRAARSRVPRKPPHTCGVSEPGLAGERGGRWVPSRDDRCER